jgi:hypothetical protein
MISFIYLFLTSETFFSMIQTRILAYLSVMTIQTQQPFLFSVAAAVPAQFLLDLFFIHVLI